MAVQNARPKKKRPIEAYKENVEDALWLVRHAVVAVCAAFETCLADRVMTFVGPLLRSKNPSSRLRSIALTAYDWMIIEQATNRGYAMRNIAERYIRENSSTAPNKIGEFLSLIGEKSWTKAVDSRRNVAPGRKTPPAAPSHPRPAVGTKRRVRRYRFPT